ncbi:hypothetical protein ACFQE7_29145 [Nonomuraea ferruginea]|uniref:hypothetical protein n=1 Tax=Nonomuraea ferruginea TaxID=46174 RepID=UPI003612F9A1
MAGVEVAVAQRQHRAPPEVEDRAALLVGGADPEGGQPGRRAAGAARVLPQPGHLGHRRERVADRGRPPEHHASVEQVGHHGVGGDRGLADGDVPDQVGRGEGRAGDPARQAVVERQRQPAADDRLVGRRQPFGERDGRGAVEPHPGAQVLEVRAVHDRHRLSPALVRKYTAKSKPARRVAVNPPL